MNYMCSGFKASFDSITKCYQQATSFQVMDYTFIFKPPSVPTTSTFYESYRQNYSRTIFFQSIVVHD